MRSYIFTEHERMILKEWLRTGTEIKGIRMIFSRIRLFSQLKEDIEIIKEVQTKINE